MTIVCINCGCVDSRYQVAGELLPDTRAVVFVADGAGDFRAASTSLRHVLKRDSCPVEVHTFVWSHGYGRIVRDQLDYTYARTEGCKLARAIVDFRQAHPDMPVYLLGHSAGSVVVLAAAEALPPGSIAGMALLSPSLSTFYDVRPALRALRRHLDVYYSRHDWLYLGVGTGFWGTSDHLRAAASGRVGFQTYPDNAEDHALYAKLRQHAWRPADWWTGNQGGHYGCYQPAFLRATVVPFLFSKNSL